MDTAIKFNVLRCGIKCYDNVLELFRWKLLLKVISMHYSVIEFYVQYNKYLYSISEIFWFAYWALPLSTHDCKFYTLSDGSTSHMLGKTSFTHSKTITQTLIKTQP